jgi:hypothetical protein
MKSFLTFLLTEAKLGKHKSSLGVIDLDRVNNEYINYIHDGDEEESLSKSEIITLIKELEHLPDPVKIYRVLDLENDELNKEHLGNYWTWQESSAIKFARDNFVTSKNKVLLTAEIDKQNVDWQISCDQYFQNEHVDECEIYVNDENQDKIRLVSERKL